MSKEPDTWFTVVVLATFVALLLGISWTLSAWRCNSEWRDSGFQSRFRPMQGCRISRDGRVWLPAKNYREVPHE